MGKRKAPYGAWPSPVSAAVAAAQALRFGLVQSDGERLCWSEQRPAEDGRTTIMSLGPDGRMTERLPPPVSTRSRVHEYGGGEFLATGGNLFFVNDADQDIYRISGDGPARVTDAPEVRFADMTFDPVRNRLVCVAERHSPDSPGLPQNFLVAVVLDGPEAGTITHLVEGRDFYASPRVSPDGRTLVWLEWDLPGMPWECAALMSATFDAAGGLADRCPIAGGAGNAAFQPTWSSNADLVFVWEDGPWSSLYRWDGYKVQRLTDGEAEFMRPLWGLGTGSFAVLPDGRVATAGFSEGRLRLLVVDRDGGIEDVPVPLVSLGNLCPWRDGVAGIGASDTTLPGVVHVSLAPGRTGETQTVRTGGDIGLAQGDISVAEHLTLATGNGPVHALYYPPASARYEGPADERPPVIVSAHGGPTGMADRGLKPKIQYWTSRGFGYLDVDYRGSTGYGRAYREALNGRWGIADVEDVVAAAGELVAQDLADGKRLVISGGSAGGFTVLSALAFHDIFAAGASYYGVADLERLLAHTHKFESGYLYALTGTRPGATHRVFRERSPVHHAGRIDRPVIFFQGLEDRVVPPEQSRRMAETLRQRGVPVVYLEFPGEAHGFRRAETVITALEAEYAFYSRVLGITPPEPGPVLEIANEEALP